MNIQVIRELVEEVLLAARWDDTGVISGSSLPELALNVATEIGMTREEIIALATD